MALSPGDVLAGKYLIRGLLGQGSSGDVFEAENLGLHRRVAVKILNPLHARSAELVARFQREAQAAAQIGHAHIIDVLDFGETGGGVPYMVMEFLEGLTLRELLDQDTRLEPSRAVDILSQVLGALGAAHEAGIIHRDLKPENVYLTRRGQRADFVKVLDFGIAKFRDTPVSAAATEHGVTLGTPWYMSPEQVHGEGTLDARSDLYSAGVVLYEMLSGQVPYPGPSPAETIIAIATRDPLPLEKITPPLPPGLAEVVRWAMSRDPNARPGSARELLLALEPFVDAVELDVEQNGGLRVVAGALAADGRPSPGSGQGHRASTGLATARSCPPPPPSPTMELRPAFAAATMRAAVVGADPRPPRRALRAAGFVGAALLACIVLALFAYPGAHERARRPAAASASVPLSVHVPARAGSGSAPPGLSARDSQPRAAETVEVAVDANVAGARVFVGDELIGHTPLRTRVGARSGPERLRVEADGRLAETREVRLDRPVAIAVVLLPRGPRVTKRPVPAKDPERTRRPVGREGTFDPFGP